MYDLQIAEFLLISLSQNKKFLRPMTIENSINFALSLYKQNIPVELREIILTYFGKEIAFFESKLYRFCYNNYSRNIKIAINESKTQEEFEEALNREGVSVFKIKKDAPCKWLAVGDKIILSLNIFKELKIE